MAHGSRLMAHDSWLMAHDSWLMAHGSWPIKNLARGPPGPGPLIVGPKIKKSWNLEVLVPHIIKPRFY